MNAFIPDLFKKVNIIHSPCFRSKFKYNALREMPYFRKCQVRELIHLTFHVSFSMAFRYYQMKMQAKVGGTFKINFCLAIISHFDALITPEINHLCRKQRGRPTMQQRRD